MAGRRLRDAVKTVLKEGSNGGEFSVVIAGLTNSYSQYIATFEEYQVQRYEGALTLYGPHTLNGYIQESKKLANDLLSGQTTDPGPQLPDLLHKQISLLTHVVADMTPIGTAFGDVISDVPGFSKFRKGTDIVTVQFRSANPTNDLMTEGTFALVERWLEGRETLVPVYDDDDFCLRFKWSRPFKLSTQSSATIEWRILETASPGGYRLTHFGVERIQEDGLITVTNRDKKLDTKAQLKPGLRNVAYLVLQGFPTTRNLTLENRHILSCNLDCPQPPELTKSRGCQYDTKN